MDISNFKPKQPSTLQSDIVKNLFMLQKYKEFKIQRPSKSLLFSNNNAHFQKIGESQIQKTIIIKETIPLKITKQVVKHIQKKHLINYVKENKAQRMYKTYLQHFLNLSNLETCLHHEAPSLSVLESKDEGDYIFDRSSLEYQKKDYPHFSNTIKITQIPNQHFLNKTQIRSTVPRVRKLERKHWNIEENCTFKIKSILKYTKYLFYKGYQEFQPISEVVNISVRNCKLLFDVYQDYFKIDERIDNAKGDLLKKSIRKVNKFIMEALKKYKEEVMCMEGDTSLYLDFQENFVSLKIFRMCLTRRMDENSSSEQQQEK